MDAIINQHQGEKRMLQEFFDRLDSPNIRTTPTLLVIDLDRCY
jgi:hypothetical protein